MSPQGAAVADSWVDVVELGAGGRPREATSAVQAAENITRLIIRVVARAPLMGLYLSVGAERKNTETCVPVGLREISSLSKLGKLCASVSNCVSEDGSVSSGGFDSFDN